MSAKPFRALTADEFNNGCGFTYRDVPICEDENGVWVYAYGHIDPALFVEVVHDFDVDETIGSWAERCDVAEVEHRWATTVRPADDPEGWWAEWADTNTAETPHAFPVTVVAR